MRAGRASLPFGLSVLVLAISTAPAAQNVRSEPSGRFYVTEAGAALVSQGLALAAPTGAAAAGFQDVPSPSLRNVPNNGFAQVTLAPWVESNGWRFERGVKKASYAKLPRGTAPLAAAEAFAFNVEALLDPDPADVEELGAVLRFLKAHEQPAMPVVANIGVIDDGSPVMGEILNMFTRRNLLYARVSGPERQLDLIVQLGTKDFPAASASNPSDFAARVREMLGDDKRLVRLFGTNSTIARLTGDSQHRRLVLLSYSRNRLQTDVRVRLLGQFEPEGAAIYTGTAPDVKLEDVEHPGGATEFSMAMFSTIAIVDLRPVK
jgi:hypothetical protein